MAQMKQLDFVKSSALTEMAYTVVNTVWPDVEAYIEQLGGFKKWLQHLNTDANSQFTDETLRNFLFQYFKKLVGTHGFHLHNLDFNLFLRGDAYLGGAEVKVVAHARATAIIPTLLIYIELNHLATISESEFFQTLFHELSHIEQQCKAAFNFTAERLIKELPINTPTSIAEFMDDFSNKRDYEDDDLANFPLEQLSEIGAYANDFALKLFNHYKQELRSRKEPSERDLFLRSEVLPKYSSMMSARMKQDFELLPYHKKNSFLKQMVRQLKEFSSGLL